MYLKVLEVFPRLDRIFVWFFSQIVLCIIAMAYYRIKSAEVTWIEDMINNGLMVKLQTDNTLLSLDQLSTAIHPKFRPSLARFKLLCIVFTRHCLFTIIFAVLHAIFSFFSNQEGLLSDILYAISGLSILINILSFMLLFLSYSVEMDIIKQIRKTVKPSMLVFPKEEPQAVVPASYSQPLYANHPQYVKDFQQPKIINPVPLASGYPTNHYSNIPIDVQVPAIQSPKIYYESQQPSAPYFPPERYSLVREVNGERNQQIRKSVAFALPREQKEDEQNAPQIRYSIVPQRKSAALLDARSSQAPNPFMIKKHGKSPSNIGLDPNNEGIAPRVGTFKFSGKDLAERGIYLADTNYLKGVPIEFKFSADFSGVITIEVGPVGMKGETCTVMIEDLEEISKETVEFFSGVKFNRLGLISILNEKFF